MRPPVVERVRDLLELVNTVRDQATVDLVLLVVKLVHKFRDNTEVRTATTDPKVQVRVLFRVCGENDSIACDDCNLHDVVDDETVLAAEVAEATTRRKPAEIGKFLIALLGRVEHTRRRQSWCE